MKNTDSFFYSGIGHLFNKRLRYKCSGSKCSTLIAKTSLDFVRKYNLDKAMFASGPEFIDKSELSHSYNNERSGYVSE